MNKMIMLLVVGSVLAVTVVGVSYAQAHCGVCGMGARDKGAFEKVAKKATLKDGVREISYKQFLKLRDSGEDIVLLDVLPKESYRKGHIERAISFPVDTINEESARNMLSQRAKVVVYCASFQCHASSKAAEKLSGLGYNVVDYKGGLKEWQEKGNKPVN